MAQPRTILVATLRDRIVLVVKDGPTADPAAGTTFDRLHLFAADKSFLVDADASESSLAVALDGAGNLVAVRFAAAVRCHIAGSTGQVVRFAGVLVPDGNWLKFASGTLGFETFSNKLIGDLTGLKSRIGCEFDSALFEAVGLRVTGGPVEARFVLAPRPAPESQPASEDPAAMVHVLRFRRRAALFPCDQRLVIGPVAIELSTAVIN